VRFLGQARGAEAARRWETLQVSALLLALLACFFHKALLTGQKLLPADIAYADPVFSSYAPSGYAGPHNVLLYDQAYQSYPWRVYASRALQKGFVPLWNPYIYCGAPLLAEDQPAVLYPLNLISYAFSPPDALLFTAVARLFVAGLATYWLVRNIGGGQFGALLSALTFAFSGFMVVWLGHPHTNVAAWMPAFFLTLEWLSRRLSFRHIALVGLAIGAQLTGGHAETALYTLTAGGLYYLFRLWSSTRLQEEAETRQRRALLGLISFSAAVVLGFAVSSAHLLPFWEWLQNSAELQFRASGGSLRESSLGPKYWLAGLLPMITPNVFGNPTWPGEYRSFFPGWNYVEQTLYVGIISLALGATAVITKVGKRTVALECHNGDPGHREPEVWFFAGLGAVALGAALRAPVFDWLNHLPLFNIAAYGRLRLIYTFCVAVLAGFGARDVFSRDAPPRILRVTTVVLIVLTLTGIVAWAVAPRMLERLALDAPATHIRGALENGISQAFGGANVRMYWPVLVSAVGSLVLILFGSRRANSRMSTGIASLRSAPLRISLRAVQAVLLLLLVMDLFALGMGYHTAMPEELAFPETPAIQLLKADPGIFRVVGTGVDLMPNTGMIFGLSDVRGLDFPIDRYREFGEAIGAHDWLGYGLLFAQSLQPRLLGMLNAKYILTSSQPPAGSAGSLRLLAEDGSIKVYENLSCLPRAFVVHRVRVQADPAKALQLLRQEDLDLSAEIVLEKSPPVSWGGALPAEMAGSSTALITSYEPNSVRLRAHAEAEGFLFMSDTYYPGWKGYVDGVETEIFRANYAFRALFLSAGQHTVEFVYEPDAFRLGVFLSLLALLAMLAMLLVGRASGIRPARED